ncbi:MAG: hypothetical protein M1828_000985 [Chrysothrix sp. TS-e1954]|nr:MAG: hypothetical protein M1828_000985 [Chrysothrix sp. TS-e1954]
MAYMTQRQVHERCNLICSSPNKTSNANYFNQRSQDADMWKWIGMGQQLERNQQRYDRLANLEPQASNGHVQFDFGPTNNHGRFSLREENEKVFQHNNQNYPVEPSTQETYARQGQYFDFPEYSPFANDFDVPHPSSSSVVPTTSQRHARWPDRDSAALHDLFDYPLPLVDKPFPKSAPSHQLFSDSLPSKHETHQFSPSHPIFDYCPPLDRGPYPQHPQTLPTVGLEQPATRHPSQGQGKQWNRSIKPQATRRVNWQTADTFRPDYPEQDHAMPVNDKKRSHPRLNEEPPRKRQIGSLFQGFREGETIAIPDEVTSEAQHAPRYCERSNEEGMFSQPVGKQPNLGNSILQRKRKPEAPNGQSQSAVKKKSNADANRNVTSLVGGPSTSNGTHEVVNTSGRYYGDAKPVFKHTIDSPPTTFDRIASRPTQKAPLVTDRTHSRSEQRLRAGPSFHADEADAEDKAIDGVRAARTDHSIPKNNIKSRRPIDPSSPSSQDISVPRTRNSNGPLPGSSGSYKSQSSRTSAESSQHDTLTATDPGEHSPTRQSQRPITGEVHKDLLSFLRQKKQEEDEAKSRHEPSLPKLLPDNSLMKPPRKQDLILETASSRHGVPQTPSGIFHRSLNKDDRPESASGLFKWPAAQIPSSRKPAVKTEAPRALPGTEIQVQLTTKLNPKTEATTLDDTIVTEAAEDSSSHAIPAIRAGDVRSAATAESRLKALQQYSKSAKAKNLKEFEKRRDEATSQAVLQQDSTPQAAVPRKQQKSKTLNKILSSASKEAAQRHHAWNSHDHARKPHPVPAVEIPIDQSETSKSVSSQDQADEAKAKRVKRPPVPREKIRPNDEVLFALHNEGLRWSEIQALYNRFTGSRAPEDTLRRRYQQIADALLDDPNYQPTRPHGNLHDEHDHEQPQKGCPADLPAKVHDFIDNTRKQMDHPTTGGKTIDPKRMNQLLRMQLGISPDVSEHEDTDEESEQAPAREGSPMTEKDQIHFAYTVKRKVVPTGGDEIDFEWTSIGDPFTSLASANAKAAEELRAERGPVKVWPLKEVHWTTDALGKATWTGNSETGSVTITVERFLRSLHDGVMPESKSGWISRRVFMIKKKTTTYGPLPAVEETTEDDDFDEEAAVKLLENALSGTEDSTDAAPADASAGVTIGQSNGTEAGDGKDPSVPDSTESATDLTNADGRDAERSSEKDCKAKTTDQIQAYAKARGRQVLNVQLQDAETGRVYSVVDMANREANRRYLSERNSMLGSRRRARIDDIQLEQAERRQMLDDLEKDEKPFEDRFEVEHEDGIKVVEILVVQWELAGPRNL